MAAHPSFGKANYEVERRPFCRAARIFLPRFPAFPETCRQAWAIGLPFVNCDNSHKPNYVKFPVSTILHRRIFVSRPLILLAKTGCPLIQHLEPRQRKGDALVRVSMRKICSVGLQHYMKCLHARCRESATVHASCAGKLQATTISLTGIQNFRGFIRWLPSKKVRSSLDEFFRRFPCRSLSPRSFCLQSFSPDGFSTF